MLFQKPTVAVTIVPSPRNHALVCFSGDLNIFGTFSRYLIFGWWDWSDQSPSMFPSTPLAPQHQSHLYRKALWLRQLKFGHSHRWFLAAHVESWRPLLGDPKNKNNIANLPHPSRSYSWDMRYLHLWHDEPLKLSCHSQLHGEYISRILKIWQGWNKSFLPVGRSPQWDLPIFGNWWSLRGNQARQKTYSIIQQESSFNPPHYWWFINQFSPFWGAHLVLQ